jgi:hypothetical protein
MSHIVRLTWTNGWAAKASENLIARDILGGRAGPHISTVLKDWEQFKRSLIHSNGV